MKKLLLVLAVYLFTCGIALAGNMDTYGIGAKATALGGAFSANADDVYAPYYNPAGLTQIKSTTISTGFAVLNPDLNIDDYTVKNSAAIPNSGPEKMSDTSPNLIVPSAGFAMPVSDKLSAGIALYAPFGLDLKWQKNNISNPGTYNAYEAWIDRIAITPTIAYKINSKLSIGFGVSLGKSEAGQKYQILKFSALTGSPVYADVDLNDDSNYSYNIGVMFKPISNLSFGLTYRSRTSASYDGDIKFRGPGVAFLQAYVPPFTTKTSFHATLNDVDFPEQVQCGMRYLPNKKFSIETDLVWTHWNIVENQTLTVKELGIRDVIQRNWKNTLQLKLGTEWFVNNIFTLRAGYYYDPSPIPDSTFDIPWPDGDKQSFSMGFGLNLASHWTIDGVVQYVKTTEDRKISGESNGLNHSYAGLGNNPQVNLKGSGSIFSYGLTVSYTF